MPNAFTTCAARWGSPPGPLLALACLLAPGQVSASPPVLQVQAKAGAPSTFQLRADHLSFERNNQTIELRGKVSARGQMEGQRVSLDAERMVLRLAPGGAPRALEATGQVKIRLGPNHGAARTLRLSPSATRGSTLELAGEARLELRSPPLKVEGRRIWLELKTGKVSVDRARVDLVGQRSAAEENGG